MKEIFSRKCPKCLVYLHGDCAPDIIMVAKIDGECSLHDTSDRKSIREFYGRHKDVPIQVLRKVVDNSWSGLTANYHESLIILNRKLKEVQNGER